MSTPHLETGSVKSTKSVTAHPQVSPPDIKTLKALHRAIVLPRLIEEKMLLLLRQGKVSKWFSGIGQEAIAVGATMALEADEYILPLHRNLGVFTARGLPLARLIAQWQGKLSGFSQGRERSFHFGTKDYHIVGMISHLGPQLCVADGIALASNLRKEKKVTLVFTGEGGTSEGDFHEAVNVASVWKLPVIFLIENNGYALSSPTSEQFCCKQLSERASGYGMEGVTIDGNDLVTVYQTISSLAESMRHNPRPVLVECMTFRMRGHEEASGVKYVPKHLFEEWAKKDPVQNFEQRLINDGVISKKESETIRSELKDTINQAVESAFAEPDVVAQPERELAAVYAPHSQIVVEPQSKARSKRRFVDAITDGLDLALARHENLILMGQDIAQYGGVFKVTEGLAEKFGLDRVRNTPLCESAILGAGLGLSIKGIKSVIEMQFADFVSCGFNQIVNNLAKVHYRWGANADVVVRMPTGAGAGAGPFHSQSNEAWFFHVPGLKIVYPSTPHDAKGLLLAAIEDPNPVMYFEHKGLYRSLQENIPDDYYTVPIGKAREVKSGPDVAIITYGMGVHWATELLAKQSDVNATVLDLRTLLPFDRPAIAEVVARCGKVLILHEDTLTGGIGAEISAFISQECFELLDAPVIRVGAWDTPVPFAPTLEQAFLPKLEFERKLLELMKY